MYVKGISQLCCNCRKEFHFDQKVILGYQGGENSDQFLPYVILSSDFQGLLKIFKKLSLLHKNVTNNYKLSELPKFTLTLRGGKAAERENVLKKKI